MRGILAVFIVFTGLLPLAAKGKYTPLPPAPYHHERFFLSFGYAGALPKLTNFNRVIDYYNSTRPTVARPMPNIYLTSGFGLSIGSTNDNFMFELSYTSRSARTYGIDSVQGYTERRDVQLRNRFVGMGFSGRVLTRGWFKLYMGGDVNFGWEAIFSRSYRSIDMFRPPTAQVGVPDLLLGITIAPQLHFQLDKPGRFRLVARPYFFIEFLEAYYGDLNKTINPLTFMGNNNNALYGFPHAAGLEFKCFIAI